MDFTSPSEADVDMAIHEDALLDINLAAHYAPGGAPHTGPIMDSGLADAFISSMIPGVVGGGNNPSANGMGPHHALQHAHQQQHQQQLHPHQQQLHAHQQQPHQMAPTAGYNSVEEYAALMGVKLETAPQDEATTSMAHLQSSMSAFNVHANAPDPAKVQANAAYFENLYRERGGSDATSMTLPAGVGSGVNGGNLFAAATPTNGGGGGGGPGPVTNGYDRSTELAFNQMNHRMYDPTSGYTGGGGMPTTPVPMHKPVAPHARMMMVPQQQQQQQQAHHDLGSQTLSPELLSAMIKNNQTVHSFDGNPSEDEKIALRKEELSRERNRDHSRKSRLRKKEYVESLKIEVQQLQIYQQICEHNQDLIALVTAEPKAVFLYTSAAHGRVLGFQSHHLVPGQTSFLDLVHPDHVSDVRSVFQKLSNVGECKRFQFRIKSLDGEYFNAETSARVAEKGVVCSTRVERDV